MTTEEQLIYTIWDIVRGGEINADDPINERLLRAFLRIHRGRHLEQYYRKGSMIPDEAFQDLGTINFTLDSNSQLVSDALPKIIRFRDRFGIMLFKDNFTIPVMTSQEFDNASKNPFNKFQPRTKFVGNKLVFDIGDEQICTELEDYINSELNLTVRKLKTEYNQQNVSISGRAVLVDPDDESGYDFASSQYPMPDELIENLINSVNAREFNFFLRTKSDETGDIRHNVAEQHTREEL